ncbi:MAG TPA: tetratricopeptide repeat protein [Planctomycetaceae bacterium]|nr:tetratricopeptide repeat protein [Planctomycetaceae bacterium]
MGWFHPIVWNPALYLPLLAFKVWMLVECARKDPDRAFWFWIVLIVPFADFVYFFVRWLPGRDVRLPRGLRKWTRGRELARLETAARQIGNAHQWVQFGEALRDAGEFVRAREAYERALARDPRDAQALWGAALVDIEHKDFHTAHDRLARLLAIDPEYKFGDVSLAYGKALYHCRGPRESLEHMEQHVRRWRHPEALYLLATIHAEVGQADEARAHLEALLLDLNGSPPAYVRKHGVWKSRGRKLLRKLPRGSHAEKL